VIALSRENASPSMAILVIASPSTAQILRLGLGDEFSFSYFLPFFFFLIVIFLFS
jgi:hypothetical protein